jgi:hypothetical protein
MIFFPIPCEVARAKTLRDFLQHPELSMPMFVTLFALSATALANAGPVAGYDLPAQFVADRVFVIPETADGKSLRFYTDSGGGLFLTEQAVTRLHLQTETAPSDPSAPKDEPPQQVAILPKFKAGSDIPLPIESGNKFAIMPTEVAKKNGFTDDGMLGEAWLGDHVWTWNYPAGKFRFEGDGWKPDPAAKRVALGFPVDKKGARDDNFARITIRVDDKPIDVLLDTGAMTTVTPEALKALADGLPAERAASFIVDTQFQAWHKAHPDWRVIDKADRGAAMIEVAQVEIAGSRVGPVWFTWRADASFHDYMSSMMDKQVEGAIGGNALRHFAMTVDYPGAAAYFRCLRDCGVKSRSAP